MSYRYICASNIRKLVKDNKKRCSANFLDEVNRIVYDKVIKACQTNNGKGKTLNSFIAKYVFKEIKI